MTLKDFQSNVWNWCRTTFQGVAAWDTNKERAYRFLEEATELFQAIGMDKEDALKVVDYVYNRPIGEVHQEVGGAMVTLLALCSQLEVDTEDCLQIEYSRIITPEVVEKIRNKQIMKNQAFL